MNFEKRIPFADNHSYGNPVAVIKSSLQHEIDLTVRLMRSNFTGFCFIHIGGLVSRIISRSIPIADIAVCTLKTISMSLLCNYIFDIANQTSSVEEDRINKPHRPIPAGLLTIDGAKARWFLSWTFGSAAVYFFFGIWAFIHLLHFEMLIYLCYVWPGWYPWFMRNYFAAGSYFILARLLNEAIIKTSRAWNTSMVNDLIITAWLMSTIHIQEFHDLEGDMKSGRKTLPTLLSHKGLKALRAGTSMIIITSGTALCYAGYMKMNQDPRIAPFCILQQVSSCITAYRIWASKSAEMDKRTYIMYYYASALMVLLSLDLVSKYY